jgi:hypothetical protein
LFAVRSTPSSRVIPLLLLALPVLFVVSFLGRLPPALRSFLRHGLNHGPRAVAVGLVALGVGLVGAGVFAPQALRPGLAGVAAMIVLIARLVLYLDGRLPARAVASLESPLGRSEGRPG